MSRTFIFAPSPTAHDHAAAAVGANSFVLDKDGLERLADEFERALRVP